VTPLEKAKELLAGIVTASRASGVSVQVPNNRYAQMGGQVVDCESLIVAVANVRATEGFQLMPGCNVPQTADFIVTLARDCAVTFDDSGATNVSELERVSLVSDQDGQFLWDFATEYDAFATKSYSLSYINLGGLSVTTLSLTIGVD
jgi:hypothetical protein